MSARAAVRKVLVTAIDLLDSNAGFGKILVILSHAIYLMGEVYASADQ